MRNVITAIEAAVIALALLMLSYPGLRIQPVKATVAALMVVVIFVSLRKQYRSGMLKLTLGQIRAAKKWPRFDALEFFAVMAGIAVMMFT